jgi:hypothetical protein
MPEMKESANIKEEEHLKELLSRVEKEQPLKAETIIDKIFPTKFDTNLSPPTPSSTVVWCRYKPRGKGSYASRIKTRRIRSRIE